MHKKLKAALIIAGGIFFGLIIINTTGLFTRYKTQSTANEPAIKMGQNFFMSSLKKPKLFDFLCFSGYREFAEARVVMVYRICGMPGDVVELKNGRLFINGRSADEALNVQHFYMASNDDYIKKIKEFLPKQEDEQLVRGRDSTMIPITDKDMAQHKFPVAMWNDPTPVGAEKHYGEKAATWTQNDFGPVTVPADHYFVLGDNRQGADDSRYRGFVAAPDVKGVAVWIP